MPWSPRHNHTADAHLRDRHHLAPNNNGVKFGNVARFTLDLFDQVQVLDLTITDADLKGFRGGGFSDGPYGYLAPYHNGPLFGKVP